MTKIHVTVSPDLLWRGFCYAQDLLNTAKAVAKEVDRVTESERLGDDPPVNELLSRTRKAFNFVETRRRPFEQVIETIVSFPEESNLPEDYWYIAGDLSMPVFPHPGMDSLASSRLRRPRRLSGLAR